MNAIQSKIVNWSSTRAGTLPQSELFQGYKDISEEQLNFMREERLAIVLASEIEDNEDIWTDYEYEETQTKLDIADMVLEQLVDEMVGIL